MLKVGKTKLILSSVVLSAALLASCARTPLVHLSLEEAIKAEDKQDKADGYQLRIAAD